MKLIGKTLNYLIRNNEELGMFTEKIICDILKIKFNSRREYINQAGYPFKLKTDIEESFSGYLKKLDIHEHLGNQNAYYDFKTKTGESVSVKTNISGSKICPQSIGQVSLERFNEKTKFNFRNVNEYKREIYRSPQTITEIYLKNLFCCDLMISFKFDKGKVYAFKKTGEIKFTKSRFEFSKKLGEWNSSMSMSIDIFDTSKPLCEFQIHTNRNCIKCRFNLETVIALIESEIITGIEMQTFDLKYTYQIRVQSEVHSKSELPIESKVVKQVENKVVKRKRVSYDSESEDEYVPVKRVKRVNRKHRR